MIENLVRGNIWQGSVIGIGMNLNQGVFAGSLKNPVSLKQITGKQFDTVSMARELCAVLELRYRQLQQEGPEGIVADYNRYLFKRGEEVRLKKDSVVFTCIVKGVSAEGKLETGRGSFSFGEVEWVL